MNKINILESLESLIGILFFVAIFISFVFTWNQEERVESCRHEIHSVTGEIFKVERYSLLGDGVVEFSTKNSRTQIRFARIDSICK